MQCMVGMGSNCPPPPSNPFIAALTANPLTGSILTDIGMAQNMYNGDYYAAGQTTGNAAAQAAVVVAGLGAGSAIGVIADTFSDATAAADLTAAAAETPDAIGGAGAEVSAAQPAGAEVPSGGCSFTPDTLVATAAGSIAIASLKVGDTVMAYDPKTGQTGSHTVTAVMSHTDAVVEHLRLDSGPIETTPNHPFFTADRGWVVAGSLTIGEQIRTESGRNATVVAFTLDSTPSTMWDLTVDGAHTFFVGPGAALVHNCPIDGGGGGSWKPPSGFRTSIGSIRALASQLGLDPDAVMQYIEEDVKPGLYGPADNVSVSPDGTIYGPSGQVEGNIYDAPSERR
jgi:hypothetical protein